MKQKIGYFIGHSTSNICDAVKNALEQTEGYTSFEVVETFCSQASNEQGRYRVVLSTFSG